MKTFERNKIKVDSTGSLLNVIFQNGLANNGFQSFDRTFGIHIPTASAECVHTNTKNHFGVRFGKFSHAFNHNPHKGSYGNRWPQKESYSYSLSNGTKELYALFNPENKRKILVARLKEVAIR